MSFHYVKHIRGMYFQAMRHISSIHKSYLILSNTYLTYVSSQCGTYIEYSVFKVYDTYQTCVKLVIYFTPHIYQTHI